MKNYWLENFRLNHHNIVLVKNGKHHPIYEDTSMQSGQYTYAYNDKGIKWILVASDVADVIRGTFEKEDADR